MANSDLTFSMELDISQANQAIKELSTKLYNIYGNTYNLKTDTGNAVKQSETLRSDYQKTAEAAGNLQKAQTGVSKELEKSGGFANTLKESFSGAGGALQTMLGVFGGGVLLQGFSGITSGIKDLFNAGKELDGINKQWGVAFSTLGLGEQEIKKLTKETEEAVVSMANKFGLPIQQVREYSMEAAQLAGATGKSNEELTALAIGIEKATGGMVSGAQAIRIFGKSASDPEAQASLGVLARRYPALATAMEGATTASEKMAVAQKYLSGAFSQLEKNAEGTGGTMQRVKNEIEEIEQKSGQALTALLAPFVKSFASTFLPLLKSIADGASGLVDKVKPLTPIFVGLGTAVGGVVLAITGLKGIQSFQTMATDAIKFSNSLLQKLVPSLFTTTVATTATGEAATISSFSFTALWAAITGPVGLVIAGIVAIGAAFYLLYQNSETFRNAVNDLWQGLVSGFLSIWDSIKSGLISAWNTIQPVITYIGDLLQGAISVYISAIAVVLYTLWELLKGIGIFLSSVFTPIWSVLAAAFNVVVEAVKSVYNYIANLISSFIELVKESTALKIVIALLAAPFIPLIAAIMGAIKAVQSITEGFRKAGSVGTYVIAILKGISQAFSAFGSSIANVWEAIKSFDFSKLGESLSGMTSKIQEAFTKGFDETVAAEKAKQGIQAIGNQQVETQKQTNDKLAELLAQANEKYGEFNQKKLEQDGKLTKDQIKAAKTMHDSIVKIQSDAAATDEEKQQAKLLAKKYEELYKTAKDGSKQHQDDILKEYSNYIKVSSAQLENLKIQDEIQFAKKGLNITDAKSLEYAEKDLSNKKEALKILTDLIEKNKGAIDEAGKVSFTAQSKISKEEQDKIINAYADAAKNVSQSELTTVKLASKIEIDKEKLAKDITKIQNEIDKTQLERQIKLGLSSEIDLSNINVNQLEKELSDYQKEFSKYSQIGIGYDELKAKEAEKNILLTQNKIKDENLKIIDLTELERINKIEDTNERERQLAINAAKKTYTEKLLAAKGNNDKELLAYQDYIDAKSKLETDFSNKTTSNFENVSKSFAGIFTNAFDKIDLTTDTGDAETKQLKQKYSEETNALTKQLTQREVSVSEYNKRVVELQEKQNKEVEAVAAKQPTIWSKIASSISDVFKKTSELILKMQEELANKQLENTRRLNIANKDLGLENNLTQKEYLNLQRDYEQKAADSSTEASRAKYRELARQAGEAAKLQKDYTDVMQKQLTLVGANFALAMGDILASGKFTWKKFLKELLKAVQSAIDILVIQYLAKQLAEAPFGIGWAYAFGEYVAAKIGLAALVSVAGSAIDKLAVGGVAKQGGLRALSKDGLLDSPTYANGTLAGEAGSEYVHKHSVTQKNLYHFTQLNSMDITMEEYARRTFLPKETDKMNLKIMDLENKINNKFDNSAIVERLDRVEAAISNSFNKVEVVNHSKVEFNDKNLIEKIDNTKRQIIRRG